MLPASHGVMRMARTYLGASTAASSSLDCSWESSTACSCPHSFSQLLHGLRLLVPALLPLPPTPICFCGLEHVIMILCGVILFCFRAGHSAVSPRCPSLQSSGAFHHGSSALVRTAVYSCHVHRTACLSLFHCLVLHQLASCGTGHTVAVLEVTGLKSHEYGRLPWRALFHHSSLYCTHVPPSSLQTGTQASGPTSRLRPKPLTLCKASTTTTPGACTHTCVSV